MLKNTNLYVVCGEKYNQIFRVVGGVTTKEREFGWMVSLSLYRNGDREAGGSVCGGSIINDRIILTAYETRCHNCAGVHLRSTFLNSTIFVVLTAWLMNCGLPLARKKSLILLPTLMSF